MVCCLGTHFAYGAYGAVYAGHSISERTATHEFGSVKPGTTVKHTFKLLNDLGNQISIDDVVSTCGCAVPDIPKKSMRPGESIDIEISLNTGERAGRFSRQIILFLSDKRQLDLVLEGYVESPNLGELKFGVVKRGDRIRKTIPLSSDKGISVVKVTHSGKFLAVSFDDNSRELSVELVDSIPFGRFAERIDIITNDPVFSNKNLVATGTVRSPLDAESRVLKVGLILKNSSKQASTVIYSPYSQPISDVSVVQVEGPKTELSLLPLSPNKYSLGLTCKWSENKSGIYKAVFEVTGSTSGKMERFNIEIYGLYEK